MAADPHSGPMSGDTADPGGLTGKVVGRQANPPLGMADQGVAAVLQGAEFRRQLVGQAQQPGDPDPDGQAMADDHDGLVLVALDDLEQRLAHPVGHLSRGLAGIRASEVLSAAAELDQLGELL